MNPAGRYPIYYRVLATVLALVLAAGAWSRRIDAYAEIEVEGALTRALTAFALARGLNGVISVAQSAQVAVEPAGIGVQLSPGELLDPVNDLVEQFSSVMLAASASLGLQRILLTVSGWRPLAIALGLVLLAWVLAIWRNRSMPPRAVSLLRASALILLALRFAVPVSALASEGAYRLFLAPEYERSSAALERARETMGRATATIEGQTEAPADVGVLERAQQWLSSASNGFDMKQRLADLQRTATEVARDVVNLIAVFMLQTVVFPLLFLWLAWRATTLWFPHSLRREA